MDRRRSRGLNQDAFAPSANLPGLANVHVRVEIGGGNGQHGSAMPAAFNQLPFLCVFSVPAGCQLPLSLIADEPLIGLMATHIPHILVMNG